MNHRAFWQQNFIRCNFLLLLLITICITTSPCAQADGIVRELWVGEFEQNQPLHWKGAMELYLQYPDGEDGAVRFRGILTWPDLGNARSYIMGRMTGNKLSFVETECFSGDCSKVFSGGTYEGTFLQGHRELRGKSSLSTEGGKPKELLSFTGEFQLKKVKRPN